MAVMAFSNASRAQALPTKQLYQKLDLEQRGLSKKAFDLAVRGFEKLLAQGKLMNSAVLSIVDFSLPSSHKRLFVINVKSQELIFSATAGQPQLLPIPFFCVAKFAFT